ncbi:MAG TPA: xylulose 5-phosphate 3-epimerase, partial [Burkholderiaceae bacterium]|nr:xylulose 5-phosphate 3-epimerase [Burkholderiaceae bacterium]
MNTNTKSYQTWRKGYGPIKHTEETTQRVTQLVNTLVEQGTVNSPEAAWRLFAAADRLSCVAMNVVTHMTYARRFNLSGKALEADDFKTTPEGHTGGSLNMVPAFVGYLLANSLTADTRGWIMGQGHSVAAIEAVNALTGDVSPTQRGRYDCSDEGLSRLCADFYSYAITASGEP